VLNSSRASELRRIGIGDDVEDNGNLVSFADMIATETQNVPPRVSADAWSIMLYTSGTTSRPKGVPRRHRAERAAGVAHVAQNLYGRRERTLGVMPLYHTMGVRSLIAMSLIGGRIFAFPVMTRNRRLQSSKRRGSRTFIWFRRSIIIWSITTNLQGAMSQA
jgi:2-furoate---CoA ligase